MAGVRNPVLRVRGLPDGFTLFASVTRGNTPLSAVVCYQDGNYRLAEGEWLSITVTDICRNLICDVISGRAA